MQELWYTRAPEPTATGIAADLGWLDDEFAPEGIAVRPFRETTGLDGHAGGPLRTLLHESGNVPALWARSRGASSRLVALAWAETPQVILTRAHVTIREPEDLRGRRLGLPLRPDVPVDVERATALRGLRNALWAGGLTLNDVHLIDVPVTPGAAAPELDALARGEVDAVYVGNAAVLHAAETRGLPVAIDLGVHPDKRVRVNDATLRLITVDQLLLDIRPDVVARFLRVLLDAADWAAAYPRQAVLLAGENDDGAPGRRTPPQRTPGSGWDAPPPGLADLRVDLSAERLGLLAEQERFLRSHGFLESAVDVHGWADDTALAAAHAGRRSYQEQTV
ncbi:monooxygenase [Sphaerisporangium siamense]|uniref:ABC-type nitrate/sulfonate/bicarbonate transport system substrate-binding protein n=1 Tax=Sphaerisporangium siamense TaxID=795645 RepID=A0A7W7G8M8_9ACTN|nr:ABC transporter substrate-binding protein [Sphaerisporangium siamense]MBB4701963.1 ABC-type nitrate/sulfonate/bicarbonate transport system substrate-binding protein [Sphaerisporangium siamense]GII84124.1 monooxygenase [Sphaerisporangium siamense]